MSQVVSIILPGPGIPTPLQPALVLVTSTTATISAVNPGGTAATMHVYRNGVRITTGNGVAFGQYVDNGPLVSNTTYLYTVAAVDGAGNIGAQSAARSVTTTGGGLAWDAVVPQQNLVNGSLNSVNLGQYATGEVWISIDSGTPIPGMTLDGATGTYSGIPTVDGVYDITFAAYDTAPAADWAARTSGPGVVWFHGFETAEEVNNFRWTNQIGNNPQGLAAPGYDALTNRITTDGSDKGNGPCCLEIRRLAGSRDATEWWRPFSPMPGGTTTGNGRGTGRDDPAAGNTLTRRSYAPTQGGSQIAGWPHGVYAHVTKQNTPGYTYDGDEYWLQARIKIDPARVTGLSAAVPQGKVLYLTRCDRSNTSQEIVLEANQPGAGGRNYFSMYRSSGPPLEGNASGQVLEGDQPGNELGVCDFDAPNNTCWYWPMGQWVTVLFHIKPGPQPSFESTANAQTLIQVYAAKPGETQYTKIWDQLNCLPFDVHFGHAAVILSVYNNGDAMDEFYQRYDQLIFSKQFIPCPQAY